MDNLIFWSLDEVDITELKNQLISVGVSLKQESDAAGFLGVRMIMNQTTSLMKLKQTGLIDCVIETLGLDIGITKKYRGSAKNLLNKVFLKNFSIFSISFCIFW